MFSRLIPLACLSILGACAAPISSSSIAELELQVAETEIAFAQTMAARDFDAFLSFLSDDAVFFTGTDFLRGPEQVGEVWKEFFSGPLPPFSWEPEYVAVLESGDLALSTGPIYAPDMRLVGTYSSIWKLEAPDQWRIVFDRGNLLDE